ncbi:MAG: ectoine hydrolase [Myxococcota bacterium]
MRKRDDMTFPAEEHERRLRELRERMAERYLEVVIITDPENLMYLTEYQTTGYSYFQALVVPIDDEPFMITRRMEESNVYARTWVEHTRPYSDTGDAIETLWLALNEFGHRHKAIGYERNSYFFPAYLQDRMHASFTEMRLVDCFGIVEEGRIVKSDYELEVMRRAAAAMKAGVNAGIDAAEAGATENDVAAAVHAAMFHAGGEYPAVAPYITSGPRTMIGHATWEGRTILDDDVVFLEVGGCYRRYHTAMMRTVILGEVTPGLEEAQAVSIQALEGMLDFIRPGVTVSEVDHVARSIIAESRIDASLITRAGYSIGIAFPPAWDEGYILSLKPGEMSFLREGMTFHLIPWLWGVEGRVTVGLSETIVVTADGCEPLADVPRRFVMK